MEFKIHDYVRFERYLLNDKPEAPFDRTYEIGYIVDIDTRHGRTLYLVDYGKDTYWTYAAKMSLVEYDAF